MQHNLLSQTRQNRLIATVRIFQGCFVLASVLVEQKGSAAGFGLQVRELLTGYLGVSLLSFLVASFWRGRHEVLFLCLLAIDGLVFAALIYLTAGATSACLALFLLVVLSAALQWGWRGAALATAIVLVAFTATGLPIYHQLTGFQFDPPRLILRAGALLSVGGLVVAFGRHQERITSGMLSLFGAPLAAETSDRPPTFDCLELAASVFGLKRAAFVWGDPEEPILHVDRLAPEGLVKSSWPNSADDSLVEEIREPFFLDARGSAVMSLAADGRIRRGPSEALRSPVLNAFAADLTLVLPVTASRFSGWIILPAFPSPDREALMLGGIVATQAGVAVEAWRSLMAWRDAAASEERVRLARDLHDGTLQFMAATAMQLAALSRDLGVGQEAPRDRIQRLLEDLRSEQRQLRVLVDSTSTPAQSPNRPAAFRQEVQNLTAVLARRWSTAISVEVEQRADRELPGNLAFELLQIVREAISNAVRHGKASAVSIHADSDKGSFSLTIADNGIGMPAQGVFDMETLKAMAAAPRMLQGRVAGLGGNLELESRATGTTLRITAPLARSAP